MPSNFWDAESVPGRFALTSSVAYFSSSYKTYLSVKNNSINVNGDSNYFPETQLIKSNIIIIFLRFPAHPYHSLKTPCKPHSNENCQQKQNKTSKKKKSIYSLSSVSITAAQQLSNNRQTNFPPSTKTEKEEIYKDKTAQRNLPPISLKQQKG